MYLVIMLLNFLFGAALVAIAGFTLFAFGVVLGYIEETYGPLAALLVLISILAMGFGIVVVIFA